MEIRTELLYHYPWLPSFKEIFSNIASRDPIEFIKEAFEKYPPIEIQKRIMNIFKAAFENLEQISDYKIDKSNIYLYLTLKILLYIINNKVITNRIANLYSKNAYNELLREKDTIIYDICKDLNLKIKYYQPAIKYGINITKDQKEILKTNYRIHYVDYLKLIANLRDDYRRLVNNPLSEGYVFIQKRSLIRLIQEYVRRKFIDKENENGSSRDAFKKQVLKIKEFKVMFDNILREWELKKEDFEYSFDLKYREDFDVSTNFPPCVKEILSKAQEGQNLSHTERLYVVFFLHALNFPVDKITDIFSTLPDFDRNKTIYQVEFAKRKEYIPHSCSTLKSLNLCMAAKYKDDLCLKGYYSKKLDTQKELSHPLSYVQIRQFRASKKESFPKNQTEKKNER